MGLFKKNIYELICKNAKSGKDAWEMLQEYIGDMVYSKIENTPYENNFETIFDNVFYFADNGSINARNSKEIDEIINKLIQDELKKLEVI